jgi:hypothetical protein
MALIAGSLSVSQQSTTRPFCAKFLQKFDYLWLPTELVSGNSRTIQAILDPCNIPFATIHTPNLENGVDLLRHRETIGKKAFSLFIETAATIVKAPPAITSAKTLSIAPMRALSVASCTSRDPL